MRLYLIAFCTGVWLLQQQADLPPGRWLWTLPLLSAVLWVSPSSRFAEVGRFIDSGGSNFWGVEVFQSGGKEYVAASDRDFGLYIFEYTGR